MRKEKIFSLGDRAIAVAATLLFFWSIAYLPEVTPVFSIGVAFIATFMSMLTWRQNMLFSWRTAKGQEFKEAYHHAVSWVHLMEKPSAKRDKQQIRKHSAAVRMQLRVWEKTDPHLLEHALLLKAFFNEKEGVLLLKHLMKGCSLLRTSNHVAHENHNCWIVSEQELKTVEEALYDELSQIINHINFSRTIQTKYDKEVLF